MARMAWLLPSVAALTLSSPCMAEVVFFDDFEGEQLQSFTLRNFDVDSSGPNGLLNPGNREVNSMLCASARCVGLGSFLDGQFSAANILSRNRFAFSAGDTVRLDFLATVANRGSGLSPDALVFFQFSDPTPLTDSFATGPLVASSLFGFGSPPGLAIGYRAFDLVPQATHSLGFTALADGELQIGFDNFGLIGWLIDDVSLTISRADSPVPEPGTWAMMILGFGIAGFRVRRGPRVRVTYA